LLYQLSYRISKLAGLAVAYRCNWDAKVREVPQLYKKYPLFLQKREPLKIGFNGYVALKAV
jgi:hypothetical protein